MATTERRKIGKMTALKPSSSHADQPLPGNPIRSTEYADLWRLIFMRARDCVLLLRQDGTIVEANPAAATMFGRRIADDLRGLNIDKLLGGGDALVVQQRLACLQHVEVRFDACRLDETGNPVPIEVSARWAEFGEKEFVVCTLREIERRRKGELERELAAIVTTSDDAIIGKTLDGTITSWNPAAERLYGWTAAEIVGQPVSRIVPEDRLAELNDIFARLARGEPVDHHETVRVARDGRRIDVSISVSPIRDESGRIVGAAKIARDVTMRRHLERQQREFLLLAAHELRTPLTALKVNAQLLQRRMGADNQILGWIMNRISHLGILVDDLVDAARFDSGPHIRRGDVDLAALATSIVAEHQAQTNRHTIRVDEPRHPVVGSWDRTRIEQVLSNLIDNAIAYTPGGEITVRVEPHDEHARIVVSDQGPGIPAELEPALFERFVRLEAPGMNPVPGLGLGLFICRTLVEAHGGRIWVESAPLSGASFVIELPLENGA